MLIIKERCYQQGASLNEVARRLGKHRQWLSEVSLACSTTLKTLTLISSAIGLAPADLIADAQMIPFRTGWIAWCRGEDRPEDPSENEGWDAASKVKPHGMHKKIEWIDWYISRG